MRNLAAMALVLSVALAITGCESRQNMAAVPDRDSHAAQGDGGNVTPLPVDKRTQRPGEIWYNVVAGDSLSSIAKKFNEDLDFLVKRNDITDAKKVVPGFQMLVNDPNAKH